MLLVVVGLSLAIAASAILTIQVVHETNLLGVGSATLIRDATNRSERVRPLRYVGVASSAFQNEGFTPASDMKRFVDDDLGWPMGNANMSGQASCWWDLKVFKADVQRVASLGLNAFRLSVSWARIQPQGPRHIDHTALRQYQEMVRYIRSQGLEPFVTIHHFVLPEWVADAGGWRNTATVKHIRTFAFLLFKRLPEVSAWITLNEPFLQAGHGYVLNIRPPGRVSSLSFSLPSSLHPSFPLSLCVHPTPLRV